MDISQFGMVEWGIVIVGTLLLSLLGTLLLTPKNEFISDRIVSLTNIAKGDQEEQNKNLPFIERCVLMVSNFIKPLFEKYKKKSAQQTLKEKLVRSGDNITDPVQHWAKKILFTMVAVVIGLITADYRIFAIAVVVAFIYPDLVLKQNVDKRVGKMRSELPNFIDLLATTSSSVSNLDEAIRIVCDRYHGELSKEFRVVLSEISTGKRRRDALNDFANRTGINEIRSLVSQINQSEVFGTPIQRTLKDQALKMRKVKRDMAEKKAATANNLLFMPSGLLLISILLVILGPTVLQLTQVF